MTTKHHLISFGAGNMAHALFLGLHQHFPEVKMSFYTPTQKRALELAQKVAGECLESLEKALISDESSPVDFYFLACKPQQVSSLAQEIEELGKTLAPSALIVSLLAATEISQLEQLFGKRAIVRLMPNTPVQVNSGVILSYANQEAKAHRHYLALIDYLSASSFVFQTQDEAQLDALTPFTGSGPGVIFYLADMWAAQIVKMGVEPLLARQLIVQTFLGSARLMDRCDIDLRELTAQVTSKKGVTEAILNRLTSGDIEKVFSQSFMAGLDRIGQLQKKG